MVNVFYDDGDDYLSLSVCYDDCYDRDDFGFGYGCDFHLRYDYGFGCGFDDGGRLLIDRVSGIVNGNVLVSMFVG